MASKPKLFDLFRDLNAGLTALYTTFEALYVTILKLKTFTKSPVTKKIWPIDHISAELNTWALRGFMEHGSNLSDLRMALVPLPFKALHSHANVTSRNYYSCRGN